MMALYGHARTYAHFSSKSEKRSARIMRKAYIEREFLAMNAALLCLVAGIADIVNLEIHNTANAPHKIYR